MDERFLIDGKTVDADGLRRLFRPGTHNVDSFPPRLRTAVQLVAGVASEGALLVEVGMYTGAFLEVVRATSNVRTIGIDASQDNVRAARSLYPDHSDEFRVGSAYDTTLPTGLADIAVLLEVIEHLDRPIDAVRELNRIVRPGGHLVLSTPNGASGRHLLHNIARHYRNQLRRRRGQPSSLGMTVFDPSVDWNRHMIEFSPTSLGMVLQLNGFSIIAHDYTPTGPKQNVVHRLLPALSGGQITLAQKVESAPTTFI